MTEATSNVEFAHKIHEDGHRHQTTGGQRGRWIEIAEAVVLAIVAVATAWSGYQAARWDAVAARHYHIAARIAVEAQGKATLSGQDRLYDIVTFNGWVGARMGGNEKLSVYFERRFRPEYATAFAVWIKQDPFNNPSAPAGPIFMPEYKNANSEQSEKLKHEGETEFEEGIGSAETGESYIKITVLLATVLLLTALSQRFRIFGPRVTVVTVAFGLLVLCMYWIATYPQA